MTYKTSSIIVALDYGDQRVGVAVGNTIARMASPLKVVPNGDNLLQELTSLITDEQAVAVVVGLPRNMDGSLGSQAKKVQAFAEKLSGAVRAPVVLHDEALSTVEAAAQFPGAAIDAAAAAIILERYFHEQEGKDI